MTPRTVFIGSASESKDVASAIARALSDTGHKPLRWWQEFPPGSITLDRLLDIAATADAAVFLFTSADKTWYRAELVGTPRDNVVLEYGIFVAHMGRSRTLIVKDEEATLPSDIAAITYESLTADVTSVAERIVDHLSREFSRLVPPPVEAIPLVADPVVVQHQIGKVLPAEWHNRDLYVGMEGAKAWLATVEEPSYSPPSQELKLRRLLLEAVRQVKARTFVSLGPGDAKSDVELAIKMRQNEPALHYIPVDINDGLLERAITLVGNQVHVPVGVLSDFEERLNFIHRHLQSYGTRPFLFALLGNTLGDLDNYEGSFLGSLRSIMHAGDLLLLDVSLAGHGWTRTRDRRGKHSSYGLAYRRFIAAGVSRRTGESTEALTADFRKRFVFRTGDSDIDNTKCIDIHDNLSNRLVCTIRRYSWDDFKRWLTDKMGFQLVFAEAAFIDDVIGDGVVLATGGWMPNKPLNGTARKLAAR